jgi:hypothetical protein
MNKRAWALLSEDEKLALSLQLGLNKSSWESGEIMKKSHYKYLEIRYRAEHFLKMFTERLDLFDCLIPKDINGPKIVIEYLRLCLEKRCKPAQALEEVSKSQSARVTKSMINDHLIELLPKWENSENAYDRSTFEFVKEYDRWNNFRILPKEIQEPSAYKRRIKNTYKKHVRVIGHINPLSLEKLKKLYAIKKSQYFLPILVEGKGEIWPVKLNEASSKLFNSIGLYIFTNKQEAQEYIESIETYISKGKKECTDGLDFWPKYRELIKKAKNYQEVQNITPSRKYLMMALSKIEFL